MRPFSSECPAASATVSGPTRPTNINAMISSWPSGVSLAVMGSRGEGLGTFYQRKLPHKIMLSSELVTRENAKLYYFPDAIY